MEDILAITFLFGGGTAFLLAVSPIGRAIADRIRRSGQPDVEAEVYAELEDLRSDVNELQERVDFAERLLAEQREPGRVAGPPSDEFQR
jgi:hypothetical protein